MKEDKFIIRIQSIIKEFEEKENSKRWKYLIQLEDKTLVISRIFYNEVTKQATIKYSAQSSHSYTINSNFISKITDIKVEKTNVIRKKLGLRAPLKRRPIERDELGIPIKKVRKERKNKELSELEFKAMFNPRFISDEIRDKLYLEKDLKGNAEIAKKNFKTIKPEFQDVVNDFLEKFQDINTINSNYTRDNYGGYSLIVGKTFTNKKQIDPRFKVYKSFTIIHRDKNPYVKIIQNSVKGHTDTVYYLINEDTMVKINKWDRYGK